MAIVYLVIPCYNEEEVLTETHRQLHTILDALITENLISKESRILFVDDGSKDKTWDLITEIHNEDHFVQGLKLSRNRGHQNALLAGLMEARTLCDCAISLDADLQDDVGVIRQFILEFKKGNDVVYGVRSSRETDTFFKRNTALLFYRLMKVLGVDIVYNHADYRLMSRRALDALSEFREVNLFLRGIVPLVGFPSSVVTYERHERFAGESKYPFIKMLSFAVNGITSFSVKPIRMIAVLGFIVFFLGMAASIYYALGALLKVGEAVSGWPSLICSIWMLGGIQLLGIGVVGEYVGKIYLESKHRPPYVIDEYLR